MSVPERQGPRAIDAIIRRYREVLLGFALKLCGRPDEAQDLVQDAFERALRSQMMRLPEDELRAWLFTVLHNLFIDRCRRRARGPQHDRVDSVDVAAREPEPVPAWAALDVAQVEAALQQLDPLYRDPFRMCELEGLSYADIAARLGAPIGTIGSRIMRARQQLRVILQGAVEKR